MEHQTNGATKEECPTLTVIDNRTGKKYEVPIEHGKYVNAKWFQHILQRSGSSETATENGNGAEEAGADDAGLCIYDPGFLNTAVVRSKISYVDGERGILLYRGYRIEDLVEHSNYLDVAYLLIYGELPDRVQSTEWRNQIMTHTCLHVRVNDLMRSFNYDAHPMGMFISSMAALSTFHPEANPSLEGASLYCSPDPRMRNKQFKRIIGKATTLAANAYRHRIGRRFNDPRNDLDYAENFLRMLDCLGEADYRPHPVLVKALDTLFILHADHEMNCSTTAMRMIGSTMVDPYSAITGAAAALYGPRHGGANEAVVAMLQEIGTVEGIPAFLERVKRREKRLMGFGHRIYRHYDPRAALVKRVLKDVFAVCGKEPLLNVAEALEQAALKDEYFTTRRLYPNIDFYTGLIYKAMGFPMDFYPLLFAIPRISGWLAHWNEMITEGDTRIWRPRQIYEGYPERSYLPLSQRPILSTAGQMIVSDSHAMYKRYLLSRRQQQQPPGRKKGEK